MCVCVCVQASQSLPASPKPRTDARGAAQLRSADNSPLLYGLPGNDIYGREPGDPESPRTPISLMGSDTPPAAPVERSDNPPSGGDMTSSAEGGDMTSSLMMGGPPPVDLASGSNASADTPLAISPLERSGDA